MTVAVLSDIHGNLEALRAAEKAMDKAGAEEVLFGGDSVGYGPDPNACASWVRDRAVLAVAGNHDWAAVGKVDPAGFNRHAREAIAWTSDRLEPWARSWLEGLPLKGERGRSTLVHANPKNPGDWGYIFTLWEAQVSFSFFGSEFCFVGHSHQPVMVGQSPTGEVTVLPEESFVVREGWRYLVNVGSVGQPRDGRPDACFGLLGEDSFSLVRVPYPVGETQEKMRREGLPLPLIRRLAEGR